MADEEEVEAPPSPGMPAWVMTFADLMSLLMCFFVLLLSFSQMDNSKFKKVAGSMEKAFGVQREIVAYEIPKGTSIIAREFSPGKPQPTPLNEIRQITIDDMRQTLEFDEIRTEGERKQKDEFEATTDNTNDSQGPKQSNQDVQDESEAKAEQTAEDIAKALAKEVVAGILEIEASNQRVVIRILEQGSFESGEDILRSTFIPVLNKISTIIETIPGRITIAGHTDDVPIYTNRFRSNWELSVSRAVSVAHRLLSSNKIKKNRLTVSGFADTQPLFANDTKEHRRQNRRVEIIIEQGGVPNFNDLNNERIKSLPNDSNDTSSSIETLNNAQGADSTDEVGESSTEKSGFSLIDSLFDGQNEQ
jgi:chemotaxis protein MotB